MKVVEVKQINRVKSHFAADDATALRTDQRALAVSWPRQGEPHAHGVALAPRDGRDLVQMLGSRREEDAAARPRLDDLGVAAAAVGAIQEGKAAALEVVALRVEVEHGRVVVRADVGLVHVRRRGAVGRPLQERRWEERGKR